MTKRTHIRLALTGTILVSIVAAVIVWPKGPDINIQIGGIDIQQELKLRLGLDLRGGTQLTYEADMSQIDQQDQDQALSSARDTIERRVNALGVSEPVVQTNQTGDASRILIELPGVTDVEEAAAQIGETPSLDFRAPLVDDPLNVTPPEIPDIAIPEAIEGDEASQEAQQAALQEQFAAYALAVEQYNAAIDANFERTELTGALLDRALLSADQYTGEPTVVLEFNAEGRELFGNLTREHVGQPFAIYLDDELISAPTILTEIFTGQASITGLESQEAAKELVERLNAGALAVPITLVNQTTVGPSLGEASINASITAATIGLIIVAIFMIAFYRLPGLVSVIALALYAGLTLAIFKLLAVTLTLAGIAGFILSIGIAVDANVLIFEHLREELRKGIRLKEAVERGFTAAWAAIRDSNISTLITCLLLAWFGTSIVQGFAVTLAIGVLVSMFTAIIVTRTLLRVLTQRNTKDASDPTVKRLYSVS